MRTTEESNKISYPGWPAVWAIYSVDNLCRSILLPIVLSLLALIICICSAKPSTLFIEYVSNAILLVGPSILGFTLSGYALMMGLSNSKFIRGLAKYKEDGKNYTMFQSLNATFAIVLLMAFITTIMGICTDLLLKAKMSFPNLIEEYCEVFNWTFFFILLFLLFYTINAVKDVVINIFNFGQYVQSCVDLESDMDEMSDE